MGHYDDLRQAQADRESKMWDRIKTHQTTLSDIEKIINEMAEIRKEIDALKGAIGALYITHI